MKHQKMLKSSLKKTSLINHENENVAILDESRSQNAPNSSRRICNRTENGKKDPNLAVRTGERFGINAIGIQGINCKSAIYFNHKNNAYNFSIILCKYALQLFKNPIIHKKISNAINDPNLNETNIKLKLLLPEITKKEHDLLFDIDGNLNYKKLKSLCKKYHINHYKINKVQKEILIQNLYDKKLIELIKKERKLNLIMDNARIHKAKITKIVAEILNINIVYLPPYCPFLNPIEQVWKDVKRELYKYDFKSLDEMIGIFRAEFNKIVDNTSYYESWAMKFFDTILW